jgi:hypothetical protein
MGRSIMQCKVIASDPGPYIERDPLGDCLNAGVAALIGFLHMLSSGHMENKTIILEIKNMRFLSVAEYQDSFLREPSDLQGSALLDPDLQAERLKVELFLAREERTIKMLDKISLKLNELVKDPLKNYEALVRVSYLYIDLTKANKDLINQLLGSLPYDLHKINMMMLPN